MSAFLSSPKIVIVGSGPAGCYAAQFLRKQWPDGELTIVDSQLAPYGLVRNGIAPDHQGTKAVTRQFDRLFERQNVHFRGGVEIGRDVPYAFLADNFDVVVLATGVEADRTLPIPTDPRADVRGAGSLMRALNGDPTVNDTLSPIGSRAIIVGTGNVAIDVARMLTAPMSHFRGSDVDDTTLQQLRAVAVERVDIVGRSSLAQAKFDIAMVKELSRLDGVNVTTHARPSESNNEIVTLLQEGGTAGNVQVVFHFNTSPDSVEFRDGTTILNVTDPQGRHAFEVDSIITAIGFEASTTRPDQTEIINRPNVFLTGWRRRGAVGALAANRRCAQEMSAEIGAAIQQGVIQVHADGLAALDAETTPVRPIDFPGWRRIDTHELSNATADRTRTKVTRLDELRRIGTSTATDTTNSQHAAPSTACDSDDTQRTAL
jgi:ferredoxin/flavodoxin---NADP+ reductase